MSFQFSAHRPVVMGTHWMISTDHPLASQAGAAVFEAGGNAIDAAVAANLVLAVVRPHMCGIGGDLFALIARNGQDKVDALNASGKAPAKMTLEHYQSLGLDKIPENGILTATVPGAVDGWDKLLKKHGTMGLDTLLAKAIDLAENGFPYYQELVEITEIRKSVLAQSPVAMAVHQPGGKTAKVGTRFIQKDLAGSLRLLAENGPEAFYKGPIGEKLVEFSHQADGCFEMEDLAAQMGAAQWVAPVSTGYRGFEIISQPPPSQGIALLLQANMLENYDLTSMGFGSPELLHLMVEAKKLAFADRDAYVCDPDFHSVPIDQMLDKASAAENAKRIDPAKAAAGYEPRRFTMGGDDTIFLCAADADGNAVSLIQSLYEAYGSCVMVPGCGMMLHNRGRGFSLDPSHPNKLEAGKRPYHTLHPAMILKDGKPYIVLGTPGADGQTQSIIQIATSLLDFGANVQEAVEAPRWRSNPDGSLIIEDRFPAESLAKLKAMGHKLDVPGPWAGIMGSAHAIFVDQANGVLQGGADPRRQAYSIGG